MEKGPKGPFITVTGNKKALESYLKRFGCIPIFDGNPRRRKIARPGKDGHWELCEPDGSTELEALPETIDNVDDKLRLLATHTWYLIGYTIHPTLVVFDFGMDGNGYSQYTSWHHGSIAPLVRDYYWRFSINENRLNIEWENEDTKQIPFVLKKEMRAASSLADGSLNFYDMTLTVDAPLFPPSADLAKNMLLEYWGKEKVTEQNIIDDGI